LIEVGKHTDLSILRETVHGLFLSDDDGEEILLPNKYCPKEFKIWDKLHLFVYRDFEDRKIATNLEPLILLHDFAFLKVSMVTDVGAFLDWGLEKDLMVPFKEQRQKMEENRWYVVYMDLDEQTDRLYASNKIDKYLSNEELTVSEGDKVELVITQKTDLGYTCIVNKKHKGLIFEDEIFKKIDIGDKISGFVKKVREDNKLDISLQQQGYDLYNDENSEKIIQLINANEGFLDLTDKSSPDEIYRRVGISKKAFKKSIGALYKQRKILLSEKGISIIEPSKP
jgi:predicted RNA-binding protein (virulence factor B family)